MPLRELVHWFVGACVLAIVVRTWLVMGFVVPVTVAGDSMAPTLVRSQRVLVDRTAYLRQEPRRGEVIVFRCPRHADQLCIKRIAGLPGELIAIDAGRLFANGTPLSLVDPGDFAIRFQDRVTYEQRTGAIAQETIPWELAASEYFVVGDNRETSNDSRNWPHGPGLPRRLIVGRPMGVR